MAENFLGLALEQGEFFISVELVLGRDHAVPEAEAFVQDASRESNGIKIISITDLPGGNPALPPESFAAFIAERGLTPLAHLTGKDANRAFLEGRLHALARIGVENILALTGDAQKDGFLGRPKPVYDLDSVLLLGLIKAMGNGIEYNLGSRAVRSTPCAFLAGAVVNPYKTREPDQMMQFYKLQLKVAAGARFIITQLGFNLRKLYELKQYLMREGLGTIPVVANVYVPTATIARMMKEGEVAGCVIPDALIERLEKEKKPERLERAALMVAAAKDLGFAGAHVGGFRLSHADYLTIRDRALEIGADWRQKAEDLIFAYPGEFYLLPPGEGGLSHASGAYQTAVPPKLSWLQHLTMAVHGHLVAEDSAGARFLSARLGISGGVRDEASWRRGFWYGLLGTATLYRKAVLGCLGCGDCLQDHLNYAGCTMRWCYKGLRNGPCGGSRVDGSCEARTDLPCVWGLVYLSTLGAREDPTKFAHIWLPPRDWSLDQTNALANRLAGVDNYPRRRRL
ncbi:MAG: methylenetetrahydrofolate reductase C-terminal domain-containing protein [Acidobacteriota bacterium]|jgi:methylenetetrahydrofolate reductase (NADPH)